MGAMAKSYSPPPQEGYEQLELCFDQPTLPPQEKNSELEQAIQQSTIPEFLREIKPFLNYPNPQKVPEILLEYFPGQFGRKQVLDSQDLLKLRGPMKGVYETYSNWMGFLNGAIPYSLADTYLGENTPEKERLMITYLGKRVQSKIVKYRAVPEYGTRIGELFREQVLHYQKEIVKGNRKRRD
jgi:hypothetical protein